MAVPRDHAPISFVVGLKSQDAQVRKQAENTWRSHAARAGHKRRAEVQTKTTRGFRNFYCIGTMQSNSTRDEAAHETYKKGRKEAAYKNFDSDSSSSDSPFSRFPLSETIWLTTPNSDGLIDPFSTSLSLQRKTDLLLKFYAGPYVDKLYWSKDFINEYNSHMLPLALQHPVLFNAIIYKALIEFRLAGGSIAKDTTPMCIGHHAETRVSTHDFLYYKYHALQSLRKRLDAAFAKTADVACALALLFLIRNEIMAGTVVELRMHLCAMRRLIGMGIELEMLPPTIHAPCLLAVNLACFLCREIPPLKPSPVQESELSLGTAAMLQDCPLAGLSRLGEGFLEPSVSKKLGPKLLSYLQWQINFVKYKELCVAGFMPNTTPQEFGIVTSMICQADYHLLCLPFLSTLTPLQDVVRLTLLIADVASFGGLPSRTTMARAMSSQLKRAMLDSDLPALWKIETREIAEVLFWACFVGAHVSVGCKERPWFIVQLVRRMEKLEVKDERDVLDVLLRFIYTERLYNFVGQSILDEAIEFREDAAHEAQNLCRHSVTR
ncbi:hypothetical protein H2200_004827 [Cladophialophora chaetospira]|uniref:Uncharacterized protein n=1 Tax=Cladophialophora chaetospira TaxID=386627 RepID=A0AA39CKI8_9EURO|nr:hypothetical protein H2200_004827 [Cladophialophora chaetospira]